MEETGELSGWRVSRSVKFGRGPSEVLRVKFGRWPSEVAPCGAVEESRRDGLKEKARSWEAPGFVGGQSSAFKVSMSSGTVSNGPFVAGSSIAA